MVQSILLNALLAKPGLSSISGSLISFNLVERKSFFEPMISKDTGFKLNFCSALVSWCLYLVYGESAK